MAAVAMLLEHVITSSNANKYSAIGTLFAAFVGLAALLFVGIQAIQLKTSVDIQAQQSQMQLAAFRVERRPYLFLEDVDPILSRNDPEGGWFGGVELRFRNVGRDPATITGTEYLVASDVNGVINLVKWFDEESGGFPDIKVLFPEQTDFRVPMHPNIAPPDKKPRLIYIGAVISYSGPHQGMRYWYKFSRMYALELKRVRHDKGEDFEFHGIHPLKPDHDWDRNDNPVAPKLSEPDWQKYLSQAYINRITQ
jgi:hypothetical protein